MTVIEILIIAALVFIAIALWVTLKEVTLLSEYVMQLVMLDNKLIAEIGRKKEQEKNDADNHDKR